MRKNEGLLTDIVFITSWLPWWTGVSQAISGYLKPLNDSSNREKDYLIWML